MILIQEGYSDVVYTPTEFTEFEAKKDGLKSFKVKFCGFYRTERQIRLPVDERERLSAENVYYLFIWEEEEGCSYNLVPAQKLKAISYVRPSLLNKIGYPSKLLKIEKLPNQFTFRVKLAYSRRISLPSLLDVKPGDELLVNVQKIGEAS